MNHFIKRRSDESAESYEVGVYSLGAFEDLFAGDHDAHVDHLVVVAGEHYADNVLANIVDIALHSGEHNLALSLDQLTSGGEFRFLSFHEWRQVCDCFLHYAS